MLEWNNTSGFGWDHENNMLEAPQPVWQAYTQVNKNATKWRGKKFPHYAELCLVFGKDRANGKDAQTVADVVSEIDNEQEQDSDDRLEELSFDRPPNTTSSAPPPLREESSIRRKRKKK